jgi:lysophospholipase L1-like esterase
VRNVNLAELKSYVATGDSFTEGLEDDFGPAGRHLGWADRVAAGLAAANGTLEYANLAVRGRLLGEVIADQLPAAVALKPSLISFHAGANDALRPRVDLPAVLARYRDGVASLAGSGARVLLFTVITRAGGTGRTADLLASRFDAFNAAIRAAALEYDCLLVDPGAAPALHDRRLWHEDRLHLAPEGHARVAAAVLERLGVTDPALLGGPVGWWREPLPARPSRSPVARRAADLSADVRWLRRHFAPWAGRRLRGVSSGDSVTAKHAGFVQLKGRGSDPAKAFDADS